MSVLMKNEQMLAGLVPSDIEFKVISVTTPSSLNTLEVIADFPTGWSAENTYIISFCCNNENNMWSSNAPEITVISTETIGIRAKVSLVQYADRPIKIMLARVITT